MTWAQQQKLVKSLAEQAQDKKRETRRIRGKLKAWTSRYLSRPETLVWLFAMGSFWAAGSPSVVESGTGRRSMIAAINTSLLAWQLVNRQVALAKPAASHPPDGQQ